MDRDVQDGGNNSLESVRGGQGIIWVLLSHRGLTRLRQPRFPSSYRLIHMFHISPILGQSRVHIPLDIQNCAVFDL